MKEFSPFRLDPVNQCLWRGDGPAEERILLAPKAFAVLRYLVEHPGRLVTQDELFEALWPKTYVQPEVLKSHIAAIRAVLGDDARTHLHRDAVPMRVPVHGPRDRGRVGEALADDEPSGGGF